jgi:chitin synthase
MLQAIGRMKRPDVQIAWREKLTIFFLIFLLNGVVVFYIAVFGTLLCPNLNKVWSSGQVAQHTGTTDYYVSVQGQVYDVSNFVHGDHSDIANQPSNGLDTLDQLAGTDMTYYFPVPLTLGCPGLVSDNTITITPKNFTNLAPTAMHLSGSQQQASQALKQQNWYTAVFQPKIRNYYKGALVWDTSTIAAQAADQTIAKCVFE